MSDPERWLDDPAVAEPLRQALSRRPQVRELDRATRTRVGARLGRLGAAPLTMATWFSVKSAAALGIAGGVAAAGALKVADHYHFFQASRESVPRILASRPTAAHGARPQASAPVAPASATTEAEPDERSEAPVPALNPSTDLPRAPRLPSTSTPSPSASARLAEESTLLERARRALTSAPEAALLLLSEHASRFPDGQLAAERRLLEVDALYRVGRRTEARALASRLLASGATGIYAERVERLLEKIDAGSIKP